MFDLPFPFQFVQRNRNAHGSQPYQVEYVYKFFVRNASSRRKIIVQVKQYGPTLFTVDFYATVAAKLREVRNLQSSKYRYLTHIGSANRVAATILAILHEVRTQWPAMSFAFQAATMMTEESDENNRRFRVYRTMMSLITGAENSVWQAEDFQANSFIFVYQKRFSANRISILKEYGKVFEKTFEEAADRNAPD